MDAEKREAGIRVLVQAMVIAGVPQDEAEKAAPLLVDQSEKIS